MEKKHNDNWIDYIADKVYENYNGRQVIIWGAFETANNISDKLKERYDIDTAFYVDGNTVKVDNDQIFSPNCLYGKADKYYVVIPLTFYQTVKERISEYGYREEIDYYYFCDCIVRQEPNYYEDAHGNKIIGKYEGLKFGFFGFNSTIEIGENVSFKDTCLYFYSNSTVQIRGNVDLKENLIHIYNDSNIQISDNAELKNNKIHILNNSSMLVGNNTQLKENTVHISNHTVMFIGDNTKFRECHVTIHSGVRIVLADCIYFEKAKMYAGDNARLEIKCGCMMKDLHISVYECGEIVLGEKIEVTGDVWEVRENAKLHIGSGSRFLYSTGGTGTFHIAADAMMDIGKNFTILKNYRIVVASGTKILIGNDCVMSFNITMYSSDLHSIFDVITEENINSNDKIKKERKIVIGNHVWLGVSVTVLYNTQIGDGSIIGAMSLVKSKVPNNCIAAGNPAKVIRHNIAWSVNDGSDDILDCGEEYINLTEEIQKE